MVQRDLNIVDPIAINILPTRDQCNKTDKGKSVA